MKRRGFLSVATAGFVPGIHFANAASSMKDTVAAATGLIQTQVDLGRVESAALDIRRGSFVETRAFGKASSPDAIFLIASITKPMSATGIMILADRWELKLSDPVSKFIPEFS